MSDSKKKKKDVLLNDEDFEADLAESRARFSTDEEEGTDSFEEEDDEDMFDGYGESLSDPEFDEAFGRD